MVERLKRINLFDILSLLSLTIGANNLIQCIVHRYQLYQYFTYAGFFFLMAAVEQYAKKKKWHKLNAFAFAFIGLATTFSATTEGNYGGVVFIIFSVFIFYTAKSSMIIASMVIISMVAKAALQDFTISQTVNLLLSYAGILLIYYFLMHPKKPYMISNPKIDETTEEIILLTVSGYRPKEISGKIKLSADAGCKRISKACKDFKCGTSEQLLYKLTESGYIKRN